MSVRTADCVMQAATVTGTGPVTGGAAATGYRTLAAAVAAGDLAAGDVVPYRVEAVDAAGAPSGAWETGTGTVGSGGLTLTRDAVRASSAGGTVVSFATGAKLLFLTELDLDPLVLTFGWNNATPRPVGIVPAGHTVARVRLAVTTAFADPASAVTVGTAAAPAAYMTAGQCDPQAVAEYETTPLAAVGADTEVVLSIAAGPGEAAGAGVVVVEFEPTSGG